MQQESDDARQKSVDAGKRKETCILTISTTKDLKLCYQLEEFRKKKLKAAAKRSGSVTSDNGNEGLRFIFFVKSRSNTFFF